MNLLVGGRHAGTLHSMWWARAKPTSSLRSGVSAVRGGSSCRLSRAWPGSYRSRRRVRGDRVGAGPHDQLGRQKDSCRGPMPVFESRQQQVYRTVGKLGDGLADGGERWAAEVGHVDVVIVRHADIVGDPYAQFFGADVTPMAIKSLLLTGDQEDENMHGYR